LDNPNDIFILFEWDTKEKASKFVESADLKKRMQEAGVSDKPEIHLFDKIEDFPVWFAKVPLAIQKTPALSKHSEPVFAAEAIFGEIKDPRKNH